MKDYKTYIERTKENLSYWHASFPRAERLKKGERIAWISTEELSSFLPHYPDEASLKSMGRYVQFLRAKQYTPDPLRIFTEGERLKTDDASLFYALRYEGHLFLPVRISKLNYKSLPIRTIWDPFYFFFNAQSVNGILFQLYVHIIFWLGFFRGFEDGSQAKETPLFFRTLPPDPLLREWDSGKFFPFERAMSHELYGVSILDYESFHKVIPKAPKDYDSTVLITLTESDREVPKRDGEYFHYTVTLKDLDPKEAILPFLQTLRDYIAADPQNGDSTAFVIESASGNLKATSFGLILALELSRPGLFNFLSLSSFLKADPMLLKAYAEISQSTELR